MRGWEALKGEVRYGWKPPCLRTSGPVSCAGGRCDQAGCRSVRAKKRRTMRTSVALVAAAGGRQERSWQIRQSDRRKDGGREGQGVQKMEKGLQTEDWAPGAERHILVWHGGSGDRRRAGKMDGTKTASIKVLGRALSCRCLHHANFCSKPLCSACICVHIDVNCSLCMDLYRWDSNPLPLPPFCATVHSSH